MELTDAATGTYFGIPNFFGFNVNPIVPINKTIQQMIVQNFMFRLRRFKDPYFRSQVEALVAARSNGTDKETFLDALRFFIGYDMYLQLHNQGIFSSYRALWLPMQGENSWLDEVQNKGLVGKDVILLILRTADVKAILENEVKMGRPLDKKFLDLWRVLQFGERGSAYAQGLEASLTCAVRFFASELTQLTPCTLELLRLSLTVYYLNVAGLALALMTTSTELRDVVLCMYTHWDPLTNTLGRWRTTPLKTEADEYGEWFTFAVRYRVLGNKGRKRWVTLQICGPLVFRAALVGWMLLNLRGKNKRWGLIATGQSVTVTRPGTLVMTVVNQCFRMNIGKVVNKVMDLQSGRDGGNFALLFRAFDDWLSDDDGEANCEMFNQRLQRVTQFLDAGRGGVRCVIWYAALCSGERGYDHSRTITIPSGDPIPPGYRRLDGTAADHGSGPIEVGRSIDPPVCSLPDVKQLRIEILADKAPGHTRALESLDILIKS